MDDRINDAEVYEDPPPPYSLLPPVLTPVIAPIRSPQTGRVSRFIESGLTEVTLDPPLARLPTPLLTAADTRASTAYTLGYLDRIERTRSERQLFQTRLDKATRSLTSLDYFHDFYLSDTNMAGLFGSAASAATTSATATQGSIANDVTLNQSPSDGIQDLSFSPVSGHLSVASWDNKVYIYEVQSNGANEGKTQIDLKAPALSTCWSKDGRQVFGAGANNQVIMMDLGNGGGTTQTVAAHDQPIKCVESINAGGQQMIVTGSWDKTIKYWDCRQQNPIASVQCKDRVYAMDTRDQLLVVATADRWVEIFNLNQPGTAYKQIQSPLKWQTRTVSCFADATGFAIGSIEGRCAIQYVEEKDSSSNFSFKCHRQNSPNQRDVSNVYSVNSISFHPVHGTFSTAGSDGTFHFWDKDAKHRLKGYPEVGGSISCTDFNHDGSIFAYAVSYDWHQGYAAKTPNYPNKVMLHGISGDECKPRPNAKKR
ncbi:WD40 repeat-like protein [Aureobasidium sp. EXF-10728]|nr:WD40 repeat-like protein [Aureobasidium sp. EXF-10728]